MSVMVKIRTFTSGHKIAQKERIIHSIFTAVYQYSVDSPLIQPYMKSFHRENEKRLFESYVIHDVGLLLL